MKEEAEKKTSSGSKDLARILSSINELKDLVGRKETLTVGELFTELTLIANDVAESVVTDFDCRKKRPLFKGYDPKLGDSRTLRVSFTKPVSPEMKRQILEQANSWADMESAEFLPEVSKAQMTGELANRMKARLNGGQPFLQTQLDIDERKRRLEGNETGGKRV